jgi:hypothetical protein
MPEHYIALLLAGVVVANVLVFTFVKPLRVKDNKTGGIGTPSTPEEWEDQYLYDI